MEILTTEIVGKYSYWLITEGYKGGPLKSYRLYIGGLKTHLEIKFKKDKHLLVFNADLKWYKNLFTSTKRLKNKVETESGILGKDRKKARYCNHQDRVEICKYFATTKQHTFWAKQASKYQVGGRNSDGKVHLSWLVCFKPSVIGYFTTT